MRLMSALRAMVRKRSQPAPEGAAGPVPREVWTSSPAERPRPSSGWHALGCSVRGTSHREASTSCEDVSTIVALDRGLVLAVADGAGSAARARLGATRAAGGASETAVRELLRAGTPADAEAWDRLLIGCLLGARRAVEAEGGAVHELSSTLLLAILYDDTLAVAQVGDGWVVAEDRRGGLWSVTRPVKGEYFNETVFVTSDTALESASRKVEPASEITGLALLSDGLEMVACELAAGRPYAGFFGPLFAFVRGSSEPLAAKRRALARLLDSERVNRRTTDDKTLLVAVRGGGPESEVSGLGAAMNPTADQ